MGLRVTEPEAASTEAAVTTTVTPTNRREIRTNVGTTYEVGTEVADNGGGYINRDVSEDTAIFFTNKATAMATDSTAMIEGVQWGPLADVLAARMPLTSPLVFVSVRDEEIGSKY